MENDCSIFFFSAPGLPDGIVVSTNSPYTIGHKKWKNEKGHQSSFHIKNTHCQHLDYLSEDSGPVKGALISIFISTMDQMTVCYVERDARI